MPSDLDEFISGYSNEVATLTNAARQLVLTIAPKAKEQLHPGWKVISYRQQKVLCSLCPHSRWVNVQFPVGTSMQDPEQLLEGTGKAMRHVKVKSLDDLNDPLKVLLNQAKALSR